MTEGMVGGRSLTWTLISMCQGNKEKELNFKEPLGAWLAVSSSKANKKAKTHSCFLAAHTLPRFGVWDHITFPLWQERCLEITLLSFKENKEMGTSWPSESGAEIHTLAANLNFYDSKSCDLLTHNQPDWRLLFALESSQSCLPHHPHAWWWLCVAGTLQSCSEW